MKRVLAAAVSATLLLGACSLLPHTSDESASATPDATAEPTQGGRPVLDGYPAVYGQTVTWRACGELDCASIDVPLDWTNPDGATIALAVSKRPANDPGHRVGSLLINPGGPGGSGIELLQYFEPTAGQKLLDAYDIIGFDPRGVGDSNPVDCGDAQTLDAYYVRDFVVTTEADLNLLRDRNQAFAQNCRSLTGPLLENVDTVSAARDMDVIRYVLGDDALNYLGFSYGTQLGATYAELYPDTVGRMVLDGAVDVLMPSEQQSIVQAKGFENALHNFISWCLDRDDCPLTGPAENARQQIAKLALDAVDRPYASNGTIPVNGNLMIYGIVVALYDETNWEYLRQAIEETLQQDTAGIFGILADFYLDRDTDSGEYLGNSTIAFTAISCLDGGGQQDWDIQKQRDFARDVEAASPTFGWWFAGSGGCEGWPYQAHETVTSLDAAKTAAPMLVIGTTNDPATPYEWAQNLAGDLGATLLTYEGEGHTAYGRSNSCITDAVDGFLVDGVMPDAGTTC